MPAALITGASAGIGDVLSRCFAVDHHNARVIPGEYRATPESRSLLFLSLR